MNTKVESAESPLWVTLGAAGRDFYRVTPSTVDMTRSAPPPRPIRVPALPQEVIIDLNKSAFLVIDMQKEFCSKRGWLSSLGLDVSGALRLVDPIKRTADALRAASVPIVWVNWGVRPDRLNLSPGTRHTFNPDGCRAGLGDSLSSKDAEGRESTHNILEKDSWGAEILDEMAPPATDVFVDKQRISGFWDTPLDSILRNLGVRTVLIAGINADQCVYATLMDANFHGYDTILLEDCTATTSPPFCLEATLYNVRFAYGFTMLSDDLLHHVSSHDRDRLIRGS
ncbi:MAG: rutB [Gammaproteobacteria bacterium]|jgi:ureidoacrylate peracid hydrolase|nr:rutB [Gammaproteobacteria bacterium]